MNNDEFWAMPEDKRRLYIEQQQIENRYLPSFPESATLVRKYPIIPPGKTRAP